MNGAQVLVEMLQNYQVNVILGVPGDTSVPFYEAIHDARSKIRHVMARIEGARYFFKLLLLRAPIRQRTKIIEAIRLIAEVSIRWIR